MLLSIFSSKDKPILKSGAILLSKDLLIHLKPNNTFLLCTSGFYPKFRNLSNEKQSLFATKGLYEIRKVWCSKVYIEEEIILDYLCKPFCLINVALTVWLKLI